MTHICVSKLTIIGSDNGLSPGQRQATIWTNAGILLIGHLRKHLSEILIEIRTFPLKKMHLRISSGKWRPFSLDPNVLIGMWISVRCCSHFAYFRHVKLVTISGRFYLFRQGSRLLCSNTPCVYVVLLICLYTIACLLFHHFHITI